MKTKTRTATRIGTAIITLALAGVSLAQVEKPPLPGTYYSAKDFEWSPPWPFNPYPELEAVEIAPGIFVFDDIGLPDTPEQVAARAAHQAAVEHAKALAANPALAEAERAARQAAQEAAWKATFLAEFAPWIVTDERDALGNATTPASLEEARKAALLKLGEQTARDAEAAKEQVAAFARTNTIGLPESWTDAEGRRHIIDRIGPEGTPYIKHAHNLGSAITVGATNLWPGGPLGLGLTGTNVSIGLWDEGHVLTNHQEFVQSGLRVSLMDVTGSPVYNDHSTHVAGTLGEWGVVGAAKGFSHRARILSSDFDYDFQEMPPVVGTNAVRVSNHSYGYDFGWRFVGGTWYWLGQNNWSSTEDWQFGYYDDVARTNDMIIYTARTFLPVFSSGNENWAGPTTQPVWHWSRYGGDWRWTNSIRPLDGGAEGFHTVNTYGVSKNNLVVGAVEKIPGGYTNPTNVSLAWFSSAGPTDDGRIKPDLVAAGIGLYSSTFTNATSYGAKSGTSMAAPSVAGGLGLLTDLHQRHFGTQQPLLASSPKAVVLNTTDEAGAAAGPDYLHGWGLLNATRAVRLMTNNIESQSLAHLKEVRLVSGDYIEFPIVATNTQPLRVTICWTDPAGTFPPAGLNPTNLMLVNDLDLRLISPSGTTNYPWVLNSANRTAAATTGDNFRDNVEQVEVANPQSGVWLVRVTHKGQLRNDQGAVADQRVSIALWGNLAQPPVLPRFTQIAMVSSNAVSLRWDSEVGRVYKVQDRDDVASGAWQDSTGEISATKTSTAVTLSADSGNRFYRLVQLR